MSPGQSTQRRADRADGADTAPADHGGVRGDDERAEAAPLPPSRRRSVVVLAAVATIAVAAFLVGLLVSTGAEDPPQTTDGPEQPAAVAPDAGDAAAADTGDAPAVDAPAVDQVPAGLSPADDPAAAVTGFLEAEQAGDLEQSYRFLSAADRELVPSAQRWAAQHADVMPTVTGFELGAVDRDGDQAIVDALVEFEPALDEVVGLTPAEADVQWAVTADAEGAWTVDLGASAFTPRLPSDAAAVDATREWARSRQECAPAGEWDGTLLAFPRLADALCGSAGAIEVGDAQRLDAIDATPFVTAFGEEVVGWARVVPVQAPVAVRAVLAPQGDTWTVIGVLPAASS